MSQPPDSRSAPAATVRDIPDATRRDVLDATIRDDASLPRTLMQLPATLAARYRIVQPLPAAGGEADLLLVAAVADGQRYVIKIYRYGIVVKPEVLAKISAAAPEQVIRLIDYGQADGHGYEVLEYVPDGSLRQRLTAGPLAEGQIRALVRELSAALAVLHQHDILHRDIKPENVLIRQWEPLRIALTDFGIASVAEATQHFTTTARTLRYAAPEAATGVIGMAADYWSLGMVMLEAVSGRHPFAGLSEAVLSYQLVTQPVDCSGVAEPWRTLCRGLLLRDPKQRWGRAEIERWLAGDESLRLPVDAGLSDAEASRARRFYRLGGVECWTARKLATQMAKQWDTASKDLGRGFITDWLRNDWGDQDLTRAVLDVLDAKNVRADEQLLRVLLKLAPDLPPVWKQWSLAKEDLIAAAHAANRGDAASQRLLWELSQGPVDVMGIYAAADYAECRRIQGAWQRTITEYEKTWQTALAYGVPEKLKPELAVVMPGLLLAAMSPAEIRAEVKTLAEQLIHCPTWLADLLKLPLSGGAALALRIVMQWLPIAAEIRQCITPQLQALLKEFTVLHHSPDFNQDLDDFEKNIREGGYGNTQAVEQALSALRERASALAEVLKQYYALWEQTPANSAVYPILQRWQARLAAPRYEDTLLLREDLVRPYRWRIVAESWEQPEAAVSWECEKVKLHDSKTLSVAFSPDGRLLASACDGYSDKTVRLWQVEDRQCVATLQGHTNNVTAVAFSPDGRLLASGIWDLRLWRVKDRQCVATLQGHTRGVSAVVFSPDGRLLASGSYDETVRLWRVEDRQCVATLQGHTTLVTAVAFSPDGRLLASGSWDKTVRLWRVEDRQCVATLQGHTSSVNAVAFSPDGRLLASGSRDYTVRLWRVEEPQQYVATLQGHTSSVTAVAFSPDGRLLASGGDEDKTVRLWQVEDQQCVATLQGNKVMAVAFNPDGRLLASGSDNGLYLWNPRQTATVEMSLGELIAWEKKYAGQYSEIRLVE
ncbi:MAG TPA: serine/threonine-protein kinase [Candidatus Competibacteraceae bacterium]|nr:serine/threonine-protein kinase [Candidatus Competibacteraceae bacterium]